MHHVCKDCLFNPFIFYRYNAYRFFGQNTARVVKEDDISLEFPALEEIKSVEGWNVMDKWIISSVQSLVEKFKQEMNDYHLYAVVPQLVKFIDQLTNWYVRLNRKRLRVRHTKQQAHFT